MAIFESKMGHFWPLTFVRWSFWAILGLKNGHFRDEPFLAHLDFGGPNFGAKFDLIGKFWAKMGSFLGNFLGFPGVPKVVKFRIFWDFQGISLVLKGQNLEIPENFQNLKILEIFRKFLNFQNGGNSRAGLVCPRRRAPERAPDGSDRRRSLRSRGFQLSEKSLRIFRKIR